MSDIQQQRRIDILANPTETLKIECKSWMNLTDKRDKHAKAVLAKAAIALANSGGGVIVFGIDEDEAQAKHFNCVRRPDAVKRYTSDAINSAINQYAEPALNARLEFENHPETGNEHAFVEISGGMQQPVFVKKQLDGVVKKFACYIRKPGPKSEEPHTAHEWSELLNGCVRANSDRMLGSIRTIIEGRPMDTTPTKSDEDKLRVFINESKERWQDRLNEVDEDDVARLKYGYWAFAFTIIGGKPWANLTEIRQTLADARPGYLNHRLFADRYHGARAPYPANSAIEAWLDNPVDGGHRSQYPCSFWRASSGGQFYHIEGFFEDSIRQHDREPGTRIYIDISIPIHAMMFLLAARIAKLRGEAATVIVSSELTGLSGRYLTDKREWGLIAFDGWHCTVDDVTLGPARLEWQQIEANLPEILHEFLYPLYEKFAFYELKREHVVSAVEQLRREGW